MIRFIDIGEQILKDATDFAWYDTIRCEFITLGGTSVWETWDEFATDFTDFPPDNSEFTYARFERLFKRTSRR